MTDLRDPWERATPYLLGLVLGVVLTFFAIGLYQENKPEPVWQCPSGLQLVLGNQVLMYKASSPNTRYCVLAPAP